MKNTEKKKRKGRELIVSDDLTIFCTVERGASEAAGVSLPCGWQEKLMEHTTSFQTGCTEDFRKRQNTHSYLKNVLRHEA